MEQFKANAKDNRIIVSKYQSDSGLCFTFNKFQKMLFQKNNQINTWELVVITRTDALNKLFQPSWEWHKQWWFILQLISQILLMQHYDQYVLTMLCGFTITYPMSKLVSHQIIYGPKLSFCQINCMTFIFLVVQYMSLKRNLLMGNPCQDGKLDHKEECIWVKHLISLEVCFLCWIYKLAI